MTPLPFTWPWAILFWATYVWAFLPEVKVLRNARLNPVPDIDRGSLRVIKAGFSLSTLSAFILSFLAPRFALPGDRRGWFFVGLLAIVCGALLRRHCFRVLGEFFTGAVSILPHHRVITSGAYRWVRHPSYSAALLIVLGIGLSVANWLGVAVSLTIAFLTYSYRARVEEEALLAALGEPYARFLVTRKRFIPFLW